MQEPKLKRALIRGMRYVVATCLSILCDRLNFSLRSLFVCEVLQFNSVHVLGCCFQLDCATHDGEQEGFGRMRLFTFDVSVLPVIHVTEALFGMTESKCAA